MQVKYSQAERMVAKFLKAKLVPNLIGSPGCGKSAIMKKVAEEFNLKLIDVRLAQCDPTDLLGFPSVGPKKAGYKPMETFPVEGDPIPDGYAGWLIFLDEFNSAPQAVQAAAYKFVLDRMVGIYHLHRNVAIACAGNLETDNAIVLPMSTALQSRLVHLELVIDHKEWCDWASIMQIDHRIPDYIKFKPGQLFTFKPDHTDKTYGCPRTWEFADRILKTTEDDDEDRLPMLASTLSEGLAREFFTFCKIYNEVPKPAQIEANPETTKVPEEPSYLYAISGCIAHNARKDNFAQLMKYVNRLPKEFQVVTLRDTVRRNKELMAHPATQKWISESAVELF